MAIDFELTITGLCVLVLKSTATDPYPTQPSAVHVLCIGDTGHRPTLSYFPEYMDPITQGTYLEPGLCVDPSGRRIAALDLSNKVVSFVFGNNTNPFSLTWGPDTATAPPDEKWMNWIAPAGFLGVNGVRLDNTGGIPMGAAARVNLPPGTVEAKEIITNNSGARLQWEFPAVNKTRALANQILYKVPGVDSVRLDVGGVERLKSTQTSNATLRMALSNDLKSVPYDYNLGVDTLRHLSHLEHLADPPATVVPPKIAQTTVLQRTGKPICNQILFVDQS